MKLPVAKDAKESQQTEGQSIVNILWNDLAGGAGQGVIEVDSVQFGQPGELVPYITDKVSKNPSMRVLLRADKNVRYEYLRGLLKALGDSGVGNVTFSVVDKEQAPQ